jgi:hypothetical protein
MLTQCNRAELRRDVQTHDLPFSRPARRRAAPARRGATVLVRRLGGSVVLSAAVPGPGAARIRRDRDVPRRRVRAAAAPHGAVAAAGRRRRCYCRHPRRRLLFCPQLLRVALVVAAGGCVGPLVGMAWLGSGAVAR